MKQINRLPCLMLALCLGLPSQRAAAQESRFYGVLDVWTGRSETSAGGAAGTVVNSGGMQTSFWGWGGAEELGGGIKATYAVEGYLQLDTGMAGRTPTDALFARNAYVGLQGSAGELKLGRILNPLFVATAQANPFGGSIRFAPLLAQVWSIPMGRTVSGDTSWDNAVSYTTPAMGGWRLAGYAGLGETALGTSTNNAGATLNYGRGPVQLVMSLQRVRVGPGLATIGRSEQRTGFAGGSLDLGKAKLYASYARARGRVPDTLARTAQAGVSIPAGKGNILLSWARTQAAAPGRAAAERNTGAAGYDYFLSKRTDLYALTQVDRLAGANRARTHALGIRHRF